MFVRVRLPMGQPHQALLVIDRAISSDQGTKFVYVVDKDDKIEYRRVTTGALQDDGLREIIKGLTPDDRVLVGGLQQVRPHAKTQPEARASPSLEASAPPVTREAPKNASSGGAAPAKDKDAGKDRGSKQ